MPILLWSAPTMAVAPCVVHIFVGGKFVARPLSADQTLRHASQWLSYYCQRIPMAVLAFVCATFEGSLPRRQKRR